MSKKKCIILVLEWAKVHFGWTWVRFRTYVQPISYDGHTLNSRLLTCNWNTWGSILNEYCTIFLEINQMSLNSMILPTNVDMCLEIVLQILMLKLLEDKPIMLFMPLLYWSHLLFVSTFLLIFWQGQSNS